MPSSMIMYIQHNIKYVPFVEAHIHPRASGSSASLCTSFGNQNTLKTVKNLQTFK